ncbi:Zinc finger protein, partial [Armadillidium nasatum]
YLRRNQTNSDVKSEVELSESLALLNVFRLQCAACDDTDELLPQYTYILMLERDSYSLYNTFSEHLWVNSTNTVNVGLRRSSRRAAIERRVWAEPRREKNGRVTNKECNSIVKRGRPKKRRNHGPKVSFKDICNHQTTDPLNKKSRNDNYTLQFNDDNLTDRIDNGFHSFCDEKALAPIGSDDENREGNLIIDDDDEVASLHDNKLFQEDNKREALVEEPFCTKKVKCQSSAFDTQNSLAVETSSSDWNKVPSLEINTNNIEKEALDKIHDTGKIQSDEGEDNDDDNHVSLSEALAKLIESEAPGHENEPETVTIHPVSNLEDSKSPYKTQIDNKSFANAISSSFSNSSNEISHGLRDEIHSRNCSKAEKNDKDLAIVNSSFKSKIEENFQYPDDISNGKKHFPVDNTYRQSDENSRALSPKQQQPASLLKIASRNTIKAPAIRTPLKCPVCPMRFCTVRSLLWHFGTHESCQNKVKSDILLENLITSWDNPEVPLHLSKGFDEFNPERNSLKCKESPFSSFSISCKSKFDNSQKLCNKESSSNSSGVNKDFILKVPIPKLSYHKKIEPISESNRCYDHNCLSYASTPKPSSSPTPCVSILPLPSYAPRTPTPEASFSLTLTTCNTKTPVTKGSVNTDSFHSLTSSPTLSSFASNHHHHSFHTSQSNELLSTYSLSNRSLPIKLSENFSDKDRSNSTVKSHVTVIPVEKLDQLRSQLNKSTISSDIFMDTKINEQGCKPRDGISEALLEDNGLVVINRSLSLRIMNTSSPPNSSSLNCNIPDSLSGSSCLTILPQSKKDCSRNSAKNHATTSTPDILTIVPQIKSDKPISKDSPNPSPLQLITAVGKVTADSSHIVNLILVPPKEKSSNLGNTELPKDKGTKTDCSVSDDDTNSEIESDEGEMVIDVKEEETTSMDPLSLCAVTMEDEDNEIKTIPKNCTLQPLTPSIEGTHSSSNAVFKYSSSSYVDKTDDEKYLKRKYVCEFCNKRFGWSTDLKRHVILHTGERPFKCKWCPITFTRKFLLQNHMKKIHSQFCKWSDLWE